MMAAQWIVKFQVTTKSRGLWEHFVTNWASHLWMMSCSVFVAGLVVGKEFSSWQPRMTTDTARHHFIWASMFLSNMLRHLIRFWEYLTALLRVMIQTRFGIVRGTVLLETGTVKRNFPTDHTSMRCRVQTLLLHCVMELRMRNIVCVAWVINRHLFVRYELRTHMTWATHRHRTHSSSFWHLKHNYILQYSSNQ
jgi:hypothetical protein